MSTVCKQVFIDGHVQGVFYRDSTWREATRLLLFGGVRNLFDGRVEVIVCGETKPVQALIKWLEIGPKYSKVTTIEVIDLPAGYFDGQGVDGFSVWSDR